MSPQSSMFISNIIMMFISNKHFRLQGVRNKNRKERIVYKQFKGMRQLYKRLAKVEKRLHGMKWFDADYRISVMEQRALTNEIMKGRQL